MPLAKIQLKPGINREVTSYTNEGGWFDGNKIRFRFGFPEKIGGWVRKSSKSFLGTCRTSVGTQTAARPSATNRSTTSSKSEM